MSADTDTIIARHEQDGRVLTGGADAAQLAETMERHAPEPETLEAAPRGTAAVDGASPPVPAPVEPKMTRGQQRFSELAKARDAEKARADAAEARAKELEAKATTPPAAAREPERPPVAPAPPKVEKFSYPSYAEAVEKQADLSYDQWEIDRLDAYHDWRDARSDLDTRIAQTLQAREAQRETETIMARSHAKGREAYADFDQVLASGPGDIPLGPDDATSRARVLSIWKHPQSEHLQYAILKDKALAQRLASLDDIAFGFELSRLVPTSTATPPRVEHRPAPAPYTPVNGNSATTATPSGELAAKGYDFDTSGYREKRAAERKRAGR